MPDERHHQGREEAGIDTGSASGEADAARTPGIGRVVFSPGYDRRARPDIFGSAAPTVPHSATDAPSGESVE
jgi:hypothetical protein